MKDIKVYRTALAIKTSKSLKSNRILDFIQLVPSFSVAIGFIRGRVRKVRNNWDENNDSHRDRVDRVIYSHHASFK